MNETRRYSASAKAPNRSIRHEFVRILVLIPFFLLGEVGGGQPGSTLRAEEPVRPTPARELPEGSSTTGTFESETAFVVERGAGAKSPAEQIAAQCQTGSMLFSRGDCLAVKVCTGSQFTHVATLVKMDEICWVYDSMNGTGVRKLLLKEYLSRQAPDELLVYHPHRAFTENETKSFKSALNQELGRNYDAIHFMTGNQADGIHCAEYMTRTLISIDWLHANNPARVSPGSLLEGIQESGAYTLGGRILLSSPVEPIPEVDGWHEALWQNTRLCCQSSCRQMSRWLLCR